MAKRRFWRDIVGVFNSNVFAVVNGLLISILLTRLLGVESFGIYTALLIVPIIVVSLTHLGIRGSSIFHLGTKKFDEDKLVSSIMILLIGSSITGMLLSLLAYYFVDNENYTTQLITMVLMIIPVRLAIIYIGGIFLGKDEIRKSNTLNWSVNFINLFLVVLFVWWLEWGVPGAVIAILASNYIIAIYAIRMIRKEYQIKFIIHREIMKSLLKMGILFSATFFIIQLNYRIDILLLQELSSMHEVGLYSLGVSIAEQLWQLPLAIGIVLFSRTAITEDIREMTLKTTRLLRISFLLTIVVSVALFFLVPVLVPLIFGSEFAGSVLMIQYILPGICMIVAFRILSGQLAGMGKPHITIYFFLPALAVNILLNYSWIPEYGGLGAAMATNISYTLGTAGYLLAYARIVKMPVMEVIGYRKSDFYALNDIRRNIFEKWKT